jgi:FkbM family methyltransferase
MSELPTSDVVPRRLLRSFAARTAFKGRTRLVRALGQYLVPEDRIVCARMTDGGRMMLDLSDPLQFDMYYGLYEPWTLRLVRALLAPGDVVFDLGAHVGYYTLAAAGRVGPRGAVHAFEALPTHADALAVNIRLNGYENVHLNRAAVADRSGEARLKVPNQCHHDRGGAATIMDFIPDAETLTVPAVRLDDYIRARGIGPIACIKMDIEAAEVRALEGSTETLRSAPPRRIVSEVNTIRLRDAGYAPDIVQAILMEYGYSPWRVRAGRLVPDAGAARAEAVGNVLFLQRGDPWLKDNAQEIPIP